MLQTTCIEEAWYEQEYTTVASWYENYLIAFIAPHSVHAQHATLSVLLLSLTFLAFNIEECMIIAYCYRQI